jgi:hypothetical protein
MKRILLYFSGALMAPGFCDAQCPLNSTVADVTLQCTSGTGNRAGVAFNPNQSLYYSINAGSSGYPIETFAVTGGNALNSTNQGADYRGLWWNSTNNSIEGNTYNSTGVYSNALASVTYYATNAAGYVGPAPMPNIQSQAHANIAGNMLVCYDNGTIYKYNKTSGSLIGSVSITGLPVSVSNINSYGVAYTGMPGSEVAIYDYVNRSVYFINYSSGAYVSTCTLPSTAPAPNSFRTGFANSRFFLYESSLNQWYGYPILSNAASPTITAVASTPSVCSGGSVNLSASGASTYTWSTGTASAAIIVTPTSNITYTVVGTNTAGCMGTSTLSIAVNPGPSVTAVPSQTQICDGFSANFTASGVTSYTWNTGPATSSISVSPNTNTSYTVLGTNTLGCISSAVVDVTVNPLPNITGISSHSLCWVGGTPNLTAAGAVTYTWSGGPQSQSTTVSPVISTTYSVTGTSTAGCENTGTVIVNVNTNSITISASPSVCLGKELQIAASGAATYTWNNNSPFPVLTVTPSANTPYSVNGTDIYGCLLSASVMIYVNPLPVVTASASKSQVCRGEPVTLSGTGANTYSWTNIGAGPTVTVSQPANLVYHYTVTGTDNNGCSNEALVTVTVSSCTGIDEAIQPSASFHIYPNPGSGIFLIKEVSSHTALKVYNLLGDLIISGYLKEDQELDLTREPAGIYIVQLQEAGSIYTARIIKQ